MTTKDEWPTYSPPSESGWRFLRERFDIVGIDSLPPTDERVGMPRGGDEVTCETCGIRGTLRPYFELFVHREPLCPFCLSYDITGHGVASLRGVRNGP